MQLPNQFSQHMPTILPVLCKYQLKILPKKLKIQALNLAMNHFFKQSILEGELDFLDNKTFKIDVEDLNYSTVITLKNNQLIARDTECSTDVTLKSNFNALILLISRKEDPDTLFFNRTLSIEGNTALVLEIKNWLDSLDLDVLPKSLQKLLNTYSNIL